MLVISKTIDLECKLTRFRVVQVIHLGRNTSRSFGRCLECCRDDGGGAEKNLQNGWMDGKDGFSLESPTFILQTPLIHCFVGNGVTRDAS